MSHAKKRGLNRVLAMILTIVMVIAMFPIGSLTVNAAAIGGKGDYYTFTVKEGKQEIKGVTVRLYATQPQFELVAETNKKGIASFDMREIDKALNNAKLESAEFKAEFTAADYVRKEMTIIIKQGVADSREVFLEKEPLEIPQSDYNVIGYQGIYDGQPHGVTVEKPKDSTAKFSEDGITYTETSPTITDVGEKTVFVQISMKDHKPVTVTAVLKVDPADRDDFAFRIPVPSDMDYKPDLTLDNPATSKKEPQPVTYKSLQESIATVNPNTGVVTFLKTGTVTIEATMAASKNYKASTASYQVTVNALPRMEFGFATTAPSTLTFNPQNNKFYNNALNKENDGKITYKIISQERDGKPVSDVATIRPDTGEVTILAAGKIVVEAVVSAGNFYQEAKATYTLNINRAKQTNFGFENAAPGSIAYGSEFQNKAVGGESTGKITYEIKTGENVVAIYEDGMIRAEDVGEAVILARKAADSRYEEATAVYPIQVKKADQTNFAFEQDQYYVKYGTLELKLRAKGGQSKGKITYRITKGNEIATLDPETGTLTFHNKKTGKITVEATLEGNQHYNPVVASTIVKVERDLDIRGYSVEGTKGKNGWYTSTVVIKANALSEVSTKDSFDNADWKNEIVIDGEGEIQGPTVYVRLKKFGHISNPYEIGTLKIDKTDPILKITGVEDGKYYNENKVLTIQIEDDHFNPASLQFDLQATNASGEKIDLSGKNYEAYLHDRANWINQLGDTYTTTVKLDIEGQYTLKAAYEDQAGRKAEETNIPFFCIDKHAPDAKTMKITYTKSWKDVFLETITLGFYQPELTVKLQAADDISGIERFEYVYEVKEGESSINKGGKGTITDLKFDKNTAVGDFKIPTNFRGTVSFTAVDKSGLSNTFTDKANEIIVDGEAPKVNVEITGQKASGGDYYAGPAKAKFIIKEANFDEKDVIITVGKRLENEADYTQTRLNLTFKPGEKEDEHIAIYNFSENADYTLDISYTDKSGNPCAQQETQKFTVDNKKPVITIGFDNNRVFNGTVFQDIRTATIKVEEHNFDARDFVAEITAVDAKNQQVTIPDYAEYLRDNDNWEHEGDIHTAKITFREQANYTFTVSCKDLAEQVNDGIKYENGTVAPEAFTIDLLAPAGTVQIGPWSQIWSDFPTGDQDYRSFGLWNNKAVEIKIFAADELSGIQKVEYFRGDRILTLEEVKASTAWQQVKLDENGCFVDTVKPDERFVVYVHIEDKAGNHHYISSDGVIVEKSLPDVEKLAPEVTISPAQPSKSGIYNGDVLVNVDVKDPAVNGDVFSGLKSVTYRIYNNSNANGSTLTAEGTLFTFTNTAPQQEDLVQWVSTTQTNEFNIKLEQILVKSAENNSNEVVVEITAVDNAGNRRVSSCPIKIDTTAPAIQIRYDNNSVHNGKYFKENRTATITITERNFNPDNVKISIENTDGTIPKVSSWVKSEGSGNMDNTTWTASIVYDTDGDYKFGITYTDEANNPSTGVVYAEGTAAGDAFTIDKTIPVVTVSYDNNSAVNGNYYQDTRTATIVIEEHNLDPNGADRDRIVITMTASDDGKAVTVPVISGWTTNGDRHQATIHFNADALYTLDVAVRDRADNDAADFEEQSFYVDLTNPELTITGVEANKPYNGKLAPVISYSDTNYDPKQVSITLTGANRKNVTLDGSYSDIHNGRTFTFNNFAEEKEVDDIYTLTVTLTDKSGRTTTETVSFSVNRFGSAYALDDATQKLNGSFVQKPVDLIITEVNANALQNIKVTLFKNNETITLKEGTDYSIAVSGGDGQWYQYVYTIFAKNFRDDGIYRVSIHSEDAAGNIAENTLDTKKTEISFGIDKTAPTVVIANLESGKTYPVEVLSVNMSANDNLKLGSVVVYLDDYETAYKTWNADEIAAILEANGTFAFDIPESSKGAHKVKVVVTDAAGIETEKEITDFYVTTDIMVRYYNNKPLFFGSIAGVIAIAAFVIIIVILKKRKKD